MNGLWRRHRLTVLGAALGALGGGLYAHFVGCRTGTCAITSNVWSATLFFGFTGALALMPRAQAKEPEQGHTDPS